MLDIVVVVRCCRCAPAGQVAKRRTSVDLLLL